MGWGPKTPIIDGKSFIKTEELDQSYIDALKAGNDTRYLNLTKFTVQKYLEACLRPDGQFRKFFDKFAVFTGGFVVNENFNGKNDDRRHLQIARYMSQTKAMPPQIFIQDEGYNHTPSGLGGFSAGWNERTPDGAQIVRVTGIAEIPLVITFSAVKDETAVDDMIGFFEAAFGDYQKFLCGWVLRPASPIDGAYWEVRIPLTWNIGTKTSSPILGSAGEDVVWSVTAPITFDFENSSYITYQAAPIADLRNTDFTVEVPTSIPLNSVIPINIGHMPYPIEIYSSDYRIALIRQEGSSYFIHPKRAGVFKLVIAKKGGDDQTKQMYEEKEIRVTLR